MGANSRILSSSSSATMATFAPTLIKSELIHGCSPQLLTTRLQEPSFWKPLQESRPRRHQSHNLLQALNRSRSKSRDPQRWSERFLAQISIIIQLRLEVQLFLSRFVNELRKLLEVKLHQLKSALAIMRR